MVTQLDFIESNYSDDEIRLWEIYKFLSLDIGASLANDAGSAAEQFSVGMAEMRSPYEKPSEAAAPSEFLTYMEKTKRIQRYIV